MNGSVVFQKKNLFAGVQERERNEQRVEKRVRIFSAPGHRVWGVPASTPSLFVVASGMDVFLVGTNFCFGTIFYLQELTLLVQVGN